MRPHGLLLRGGQVQARGFDQGLLVQRRLALQLLEVENLVARVLVHDEQVRAERGEDEPEVELADHAHLREIRLAEDAFERVRGRGVAVGQRGAQRVLRRGG